MTGIALAAIMAAAALAGCGSKSFGREGRAKAEHGGEQ